MPSDESSASRRRRRSPPAPSAESADTVSKPPSLAELVEHERLELMQIHAMLRCLHGVLLYADDDDSPLHADVAHVVARLLDESVTRLEAVRVRVAQLEAALEEQAAEMSAPPYQVREPRAMYVVRRVDWCPKLDDARTAAADSHNPESQPRAPARNLGRACAVA